jgi:uncharacterized lipoprotein YajG
VEGTNLQRNKDKQILIKRKTFNQIVENPARTSLKNWLAAVSRAKKLTDRGYRVSVPSPHVGRPQLLVISNRTRAS